MATDQPPTKGGRREGAGRKPTMNPLMSWLIPFVPLLLMAFFGVLAPFGHAGVVMVVSLGGADSTIFWRCNDAECDPRIARERES